MEVVFQHETLSMGWCIECYREPEKHCPVEFITAMDWKPSDPLRSEAQGNEQHQPFTGLFDMSSLKNDLNESSIGEAFRTS